MTELEQLKPTLAALTRVRTPDIPVDVDFQEIRDLLTYIDEHPDVAATLDEVGLASGILPALRLALPAAIQAQAEWSILRNPRKPEDQAAIEENGRKLRTAAIAACRFTLRTHRQVQGALDRIMEGVGTADLVQDLEELALLVEANRDALAPNRRFDAPSQPAKLRTAAQDIRLGLAEYRTSQDQKTVVDLRNRAWTWLETHVTELRDAGRYAFQGTPTIREFRSAWERRVRLGRRKNTSGAESGLEEELYGPDDAESNDPADVQTH